VKHWYLAEPSALNGQNRRATELVRELADAFGIHAEIVWVAPNKPTSRGYVVDAKLRGEVDRAEPHRLKVEARDHDVIEAAAHEFAHAAQYRGKVAGATWQSTRAPLGASAGCNEIAVEFGRAARRFLRGGFTSRQTALGLWATFAKPERISR
jgi:hypothetical protein